MQNFQWKDEELQTFGSDLQSHIIDASEGYSDPWEGLDITQPGLRIWRATKWRVIPWPTEEYGHFYQADVYIILKLREVETSSKECVYNIHIWAGRGASMGDFYTGVIKAIDLDVALNQEAMIHREAQGRESLILKSYFKFMAFWKGSSDQSCRALHGEAYSARLLKAHKPDQRSQYSRIKEVPCQSGGLDPSNVFILDLGHSLYQWNGHQSSVEDIIMGINFVEGLNANRGLKTKVEVINQDDCDGHVFHFYLQDGYTSTAVDDSDDDQDGRDTHNTRVAHMTNGPRSSLHTLHTVYSPGSSPSQTQFTKIQEKRISMADMYPHNVCLYDTSHEVFVWINNKADVDEKKQAIEYAHTYLKNTTHPLVPVTVLKEGQTTASFEKYLRQ